MRGLTTPQRLAVASDPADAAAVRAYDLKLKKALPLAPKGLGTVAEIAHWPGPVIPAELLHLLGEAFTPALPDDEFWLAAQWALYRYVWAFAPADGSSPLRLSRTASRLVDHHRTLASEQLGIAIALHLALWVLTKRHRGFAIDYVDADVALDPRQAEASGWGLAARTGARRMRPDYFLIAADPSNDVDIVYALECKGTHYPSNWQRQMKKGASQVMGVTAEGIPPASFVISSVLGPNEIKTRVLDPPGGDAWTGPSEFAEDQAPLVEAEIDDRGAEIESPALFRGDLHRLADARRLAYAGQYRTATEALPARVRNARTEPRAVNDRRLERFDTPVGEVEAMSATLPLGSQILRVRRGLSRGQAERLRMSDPSERRAHRAMASAQGVRKAERSSASLAEVRDDNHGSGFHSLRDDGTYLSVEVLE